MFFIKQELIQKIREFDYRIQIDGYEVKIQNRSTPSYILSVFLICIGLLLLLFPYGKIEIALLGLTLVAFSILNFRRNFAKSIVFDTAVASVRFTSGFFGKVQSRNLSDIMGVAMYTYDRNSHTSAFEEGNRDYFVDLCIQWDNDEETELFHFKRRSSAELSFAPDVVEELNDFIKRAATVA